MAIRMSTALQNHLLGTGSMVSAMSFGVIRVYSGSQPDSADDAATGTLLARITDGGGVFNPGSTTNGLLLQALPQYNTVVKSPAQSWVLTPLDTGEAGWWRFEANAVGSNVRLDGAVIAPFDEMYLPSTTVVPGQSQTIEVFQIGFNN